jgi:hypothetical protein
VSGKFAAITPDILVRKGEAVPSALASGAREPLSRIALDSRRPPQRPPVQAGTVQRPEAPAEARRFVYSDDADNRSARSGRADAADKPRRIVLSLSAHEYETLGLVAVKKGTTRHRLAQSAMDAYFEWLVAEYGETCSCIVGGALCRCECGAH